MRFTYDDYKHLIYLLKDHGYEIATYHDWKEKEKCVILRHDVDNDLNKAVEMAQVEKELGVQSTYFVLLSSDFYNVFSRDCGISLSEIKACGHDIGLHFDEMRYMDAKGCPAKLVEIIIREMDILSEAVGYKVNAVSMHRPSREILEADLDFGRGIINSYGKTFFNDFKYLSDSRRRWREPVEEIIQSEHHEKLHILTHPFWYFEEEKSIEETVKRFVNTANKQRYHQMEANITDLNSIMRIWEVC